MKAFGGKRFIGTDADGLPVFVEVEYTEDGRLSITGHAQGAYDWAYGGQIVDQLEKWGEWKTLAVPSADLVKLAEIWRAWHLNDMHAGCAHQRTAKWVERRIPPAEIPGSMANRDERGILAVWVYNPESAKTTSFARDIHKDGLLMEACPECGYRYGSAWLREEVPADVLDWLRAFLAAPAVEAPPAFCDLHGIKLEVTTIGEPDNWKGDPAARHYSVRLIRPGHGRRVFSTEFHQGSGIKKRPTAKDVLGCVVMDIQSIENARDFDDWCAEMGYSMEDPKERRKARRDYHNIEDQRERLQAFLGAELYRAALEAR